MIFIDLAAISHSSVMPLDYCIRIIYFCRFMDESYFDILDAGSEVL